MNNLGDLSWINERYIGIPYVFGGRGYEGCDCYGLAKLVYQSEYAIELPDWHLDQIDLRGRSVVIDSIVTSGDFIEREPQNGDFAICYRTRAAHHIGLYFGRGILHAVEGLGAVYVTRSRFERDYVNVRYGSWQQ